jgi:ABC-type transport system involved in cytochrome c biogenesis permease component
MNDDSRLLALWGLSALLAVATVFVIGVAVPALANLHNDGALIAAIALTVMLPALTFTAARKLYRLAKMTGDKKK